VTARPSQTIWGECVSAAWLPVAMLGVGFPQLDESALQLLNSTPCATLIAYEPAVCAADACGISKLYADVAPDYQDLFFARIDCNHSAQLCADRLALAEPGLPSFERGVRGRGGSLAGRSRWATFQTSVGPSDGTARTSAGRIGADPNGAQPFVEYLANGTSWRYHGTLESSSLRSFIHAVYGQPDAKPETKAGVSSSVAALSPTHATLASSNAVEAATAIASSQRACSRSAVRALLRSHRKTSLAFSASEQVHYPRGLGLGEWIFVAHHKSGTTVGKVLADALCEAFSRPVVKYTYRERPVEPEVPNSSLCHFLIKIYSEDLDMWLKRLWRNPHNRLIHFVRDPVEMVSSGYLFHKRGSEIEWTNATTCSRDLCYLPEPYMAGGTKRDAAVGFRAMPASPWLREFGCSKAYHSYYSCLRELPPVAGLRVEARRAYATLRTMLDVDLLARGPRTKTINLQELRSNEFNKTVGDLADYLAAANETVLDSISRSNVVDQAFNTTFSDARVANIQTRPGGDSSNTRSSADVNKAMLKWARVATPAVRELAMRSSWSRNFSSPRLFSPSFRKLGYKHGSRGIVTCTAPSLLNATLLMLSRLGKVGTLLPVEIWHVNELSEVQQKIFTQHFGLGHGVRVHDLTGALARSTLKDEVQELRGFMCKPLSLLATKLDEVLLVDHDARFFIDPSLLFSSSVFMRTGMLLFRDRLRLQIRGRPVKDASRFLRQLIRRRLGSAEFMQAPDMPRLPFPWSPSTELLNSPMATGESNHQIDSSVLLLSKSKAPMVKTALYIMHERHRHELYSNLHGDKETYWLACELIGGLDCGVSEYAAGEMGQLKQAGDRECLYGNLLQFHPDNPSWIVHCNCKPQAAWLYTHVALPQRFSEHVGRMSRARVEAFKRNSSRGMPPPRANLSIAPSPAVAAMAMAAAEKSEQAMELALTAAGRRTTSARATRRGWDSLVASSTGNRFGATSLVVNFDQQLMGKRPRIFMTGPVAPQFCEPSSMEPVEAMIARQPQNERAVRNNPAALCLQHELLCRRRARGANGTRDGDGAVRDGHASKREADRARRRTRTGTGEPAAVTAAQSKALATAAAANVVAAAVGSVPQTVFNPLFLHYLAVGFVFVFGLLGFYVLVRIWCWVERRSRLRLLLSAPSTQQFINTQDEPHVKDLSVRSFEGESIASGPSTLSVACT